MPLIHTIAHAKPAEDAGRIDDWLLAIPVHNNRQRVNDLLDHAIGAKRAAPLCGRSKHNRSL